MPTVLVITSSMCRFYIKRKQKVDGAFLFAQDLSGAIAMTIRSEGGCIYFYDGIWTGWPVVKLLADGPGTVSFCCSNRHLGSPRAYPCFPRP